MTTLTLYLNTDMVLTIPGVTNRAGTAQTDATVNVTLRKKGGGADIGVTTGSITWPQAASHAGSGSYELALLDTLDVVRDERLEAVIDITLADGVTKRRTIAAILATDDDN